MRITTYLDQEKQLYHICLCGELDACSCISMDEAMEKAIQQHPKEIQIDCQSLYYISSAGLGVFISHLQKLASLNIKLVLHNMSPAVRNIFEITGLHTFIRMSASGEFDQVYSGSAY